MKQEISPKMMIGIILVAVVLLVGGVWWVWRAPSASAVADQGVHPRPGGARAALEAMRAERMGRGQGQAVAPRNSTP
jgi:hypothetical protein